MLGIWHNKHAVRSAPHSDTASIPRACLVSSGVAELWRWGHMQGELRVHGVLVLSVDLRVCLAW